MDQLGSVTITSALAPLMREPRISSTQVSQALRGSELRVLEREGDWLRVAGWDNYSGWLHTGYTDYAADALQPLDSNRLSLGCSIRNGRFAIQLPLGAAVGTAEKLLTGEAISRSEQPRLFPPLASSVVASALRFFPGARYEWGGIVPWGCDCSGFIQTLFRLHGVDLPRDSADQAESGKESSSDLSTAHPGELLFFSERDDRRITHVGLALGEQQMLHVALGRGGFAMETFGSGRRAAERYTQQLADRYMHARRVLPAR